MVHQEQVRDCEGSTRTSGDYRGYHVVVVADDEQIGIQVLHSSVLVGSARASRRQADHRLETRDFAKTLADSGVIAMYTSLCSVLKEYNRLQRLVYIANCAMAYI